MPVIIGAVILVIALIAVLGKTFMAPPPSNPNPPKLPDFIDPATGKPKAGNRGSGMQQPGGGSTGSMMGYPQGGAPGGSSSYPGGGPPGPGGAR
jgi:hypothetical protein